MGWKGWGKIPIPFGFWAKEGRIAPGKVKHTFRIGGFPKFGLGNFLPKGNLGLFLNKGEKRKVKLEG